MIPAIVVSVSAVACLLVAEWSNANLAKAAAKMSAASAFVALALAAGALDSTYGQILLAGLLLCWTGDACLLATGRSTGFLLGIGAFLLGHLAYAIAFSQLGIDPVAFLGAALAMAVFAGGTLRWLGPNLPEDFRIPVFCYVGVISLMVAASIGAYAEGAPAMLMLGAIGFAASDVFVARERFVAKGFVNAGIGLPAYFGSQMLLAATAAFAAAG